MNRLSRLIAVFYLCFPICHAVGQDSMQSNISSLQRFELNQALGLNSEFEVRNVFIGDAILTKVNQLKSQGAKVHYIAGGNRSERVKLSFYQPYQQTQLEQLLLLNFDKTNGFITNINLTYSLKSRYAKIAPVYQEVLKQAIKKYGEPMSFSDITAMVNSNNKEIKLSTFINEFDVNPLAQEQIHSYFEAKIVTSRTHFSDDGRGKALLKFGFQQCHFWPKQKFAEILSLCSFQPNSGNMGGQGITLELVNFLVKSEIANFRTTEGNGIEIEL